MVTLNAVGSILCMAFSHPKTKTYDIKQTTEMQQKSEGFISHGNTTPLPSLVSSAPDATLELGPGSGSQIHRFDSSTKFIYGIDPNHHFDGPLLAKVAEKNLEHKYKLLPCSIGR